ncbi:MAG: hypothetical protein ACTSU5_02090 [Promethearchaeota archaeon]
MPPPAGDAGLASGRRLVEFLRKQLLSDPGGFGVRRTTVTSGPLRLHVLRSRGIERFIEMVADRVRVAVLSAQHDMLKVFLAHSLADLGIAEFEVPGPAGRRIDLVSRRHTYEVKTTSRLPYWGAHRLLEGHYAGMVASRGVKDAWWLAFLCGAARPEG